MTTNSGIKRTASHDLAPLHGRHLRLTRVDETRVQRRRFRALAERGRAAGPDGQMQMQRG